jgi:hypothetical protein
MQDEHVEYYKDGSVKGKGIVVDSKMEGYWEWFRKNGTKMRSQFFLDELATFTGEGWEQEDDITMVTLKREQVP